MSPISEGMLIFYTNCVVVGKCFLELFCSPERPSEGRQVTTRTSHIHLS